MYKKKLLVNNFAKEVYMERKNIKYYLAKYRTYLVVGVVLLALLAIILPISLANKGESSTSVNTKPVSFVMPISNATISKSFKADELQYNKTLNCWEIHKGLDLVASKGDEVLACYDGVVENIYTNSLDGTTIVIKHENNLTSTYMGLDSTTEVKVGDMVTAGQKLGVVGTTSSSELDDGSHVHFELLKSGEKVDPANYINIDLKG